MHSKQQLYYHVLPALQARAADLQTMGTKVTVAQLFEYCVESRWRNHPLDQLQIHQVVASIFATTAEDLQPVAIFSDVNEEEIRTLLYDDKA